MKALELAQVSKRYGAVAAVTEASLAVEPGTIHALVGENGAGKSTLLKIAYGSTLADGGVLRVHGRETALATHSPARAIALGVGMVHQHFMLVPNLSILENVVLGREPRRRGLLDLGAVRDEIGKLLEGLSLPGDTGRLVETLSVGEQQRVEIVKILWRGADILLLDEPTAVLTPGEVVELFRVLRGLADQGKTIVIVTHKLDEVAGHADHTTVMRGGRVVDELAGGAGAAQLARAIVAGEGRPLIGIAEPPAPRAARGALGKVVLEVSGLILPRVRDLTFSIAAGEILGIAGVVGNGQTELVLALAGLLPIQGGSMRLAGQDLVGRSTAARLATGLAHIAEDRHLRGVILDFTLAENLILGRQAEFGHAWGLDHAKIAAFATERLTALGVRPPDPAAPMSALSGGNQQKVVVARELSRPDLKLLVAAEPTRGVDIGATALIHEQIRAARDAGAAVLLVSSELSELRALSDRLLVMFRGAVAAELPATAGDAQLGAYMTGVS